VSITSDKARAFQAIRETLGNETCPSSTRIQKLLGNRLDRIDRWAVRETRENTTVAHQLRQSLCALMIIHCLEPALCPNCCTKLPRHVARCHVGRLLKGMKDG
jgi:hypothetical protein